MTNKYEVCINFLQFWGLINAVKTYVRNMDIQINNATHNIPAAPKHMNILTINIIGTKAYYDILTFPVRRLKFCAPYVVGVQQPMVSKKEQTLAVRRGWTATHGACNRSTPLAVRRGWTATHGFNEGKTLRRTSWVYSNP